MSANTNAPPGLLFIRLVFTVEYFSMNSISFSDCSQRKSHASRVRLVLSWTVERLAEAVLTGLRGFPARFLDVLLDLTAQFDLQLLGF